ncbi:unnamed protein product [Diplocarpon coronariae]
MEAGSNTLARTPQLLGLAFSAFRRPRSLVWEARARARARGSEVGSVVCSVLRGVTRRRQLGFGGSGSGSLAPPKTPERHSEFDATVREGEEARAEHLESHADVHRCGERNTHRRHFPPTCLPGLEQASITPEPVLDAPAYRRYGKHTQARDPKRPELLDRVRVSWHDPAAADFEGCHEGSKERRHVFAKSDVSAAVTGILPSGRT